MTPVVHLFCVSDEVTQAVAALWEHPETDVEALHLAVALAYHGLLRAPSRNESSDITPRKSRPLNMCNILNTINAVSLSSSSPPGLSLTTLIWRYVRQFVRLDAKEALQYVYTITLGADQPRGIGREQLELAWELVRRVIVLANASPAWDELVGGFRADGMRFVCPFYMSSACISCSPSADRRYRASSTITQAE